jgi:hypothetical protein
MERNAGQDAEDNPQERWRIIINATPGWEEMELYCDSCGYCHTGTVSKTGPLRWVLECCGNLKLSFEPLQ